MPVRGPAARPGSPGEPGRHPLACPSSGLPGGPPRRAPAAGSGRGAPRAGRGAGSAWPGAAGSRRLFPQILPLPS